MYKNATKLVANKAISHDFVAVYGLKHWKS